MEFCNDLNRTNDVLVEFRKFICRDPKLCQRASINSTKE